MNLEQSKCTDSESNEERLKIRNELSNMSFEDLMKLKDEIGTKLYNEKVFGVSKQTREDKVFKRANKNRPREMSSKIRTRLVKVEPRKEANLTLRDPRYDVVYPFDKQSFKSDYKFLNDIRKNEVTALKEELEKTTDESKKKQIKHLLQRTKNKLQEEEKDEKQKEILSKAKKDMKDKLKRGEKPVFKQKSVQRIESLVSKYEELKKNNRLQKHIEKRTKKKLQKERKSGIM